jgi:hypothetical protein
MKLLIIRVNVLVTLAFSIATFIAAWRFSPSLRGAIVAIDLTLFAVGLFAFIWAYFSAVQRSRTDEISVPSLFGFAANVAPRRVMLLMNGSLAAQAIVGLSGALVRGTTDGRTGSTLAFGVLVPIFGLGLNGVWTSQFGVFAARSIEASSTGSSPISNDRDHG